jgi:superfamily I DNA and/or RNA helicase
VWVVTNLSAKRSFPFKNNLFDLLIIDEASQCDVASALPLFYRAKHVVIIGDPHQLKHISLLSDTQDRTLAVQHHLNDEQFSDFSYTRHSLYDLIQRSGMENNEHPILLNEHYRCHPDIISFSNEYYYEQKLTIATDEKKLLQNPSMKTRVIWHHIKGKTTHTKSPYNEQEAEAVVEEILKLLKTMNETKTTMGIVTLFRAQTEIITEKLNTFQPVFETPITVGTAHRFQGDEKDIIMFSPAVSVGVKPGTLHWIQSTSQLLNVAVTRARSLLIIVGDQDICSQTAGPLKDLVDYIKTRTLTSGVCDTPMKQLLYSELTKNGIAVTPGYWVKGYSSPYLDFALFINGYKYALELEGEHHTSSFKDQQLTRDIKLRTEGWRFRRLKEQDIKNNIDVVIEEIKRLC